MPALIRLSPLLNRLRPALPWLASAALLILAVLALQAMVDRDARITRAFQAELAERLEDRVHTWESALLPTLHRQLQEASQADGRTLAALEERWRASYPWFDALYVWEPAPSTDLGGPGPVRLRFPRASPPLPDEGARACAAWALRQRQPVPPLTTDECPRAEDRAWASLQVARARLADGAYDDGRQILKAHPAPDPELAILQILLDADLLDAQGLKDDATATRRRGAFQIGNLDAPFLERVLYLLPELLDQLARDGADTSLLRRRLTRAEQRLAAWREIQQTALRALGSGRQATAGARFTADQYSETPYLLFSRQATAEAPGVALLLRQDALIQDFLDALPGYRDGLHISDVAGRYIAGASDPVSDGPVVTFRDTLRHLQIRVSASTLDQRLRQIRGAARFWIALIVGGCILLGIGALWAQAEANRSHRELLKRQREFTTRITHELKTPLAGIRVMAENLSFGAFRSDEQRREMADRIVDEADRLTQRVNEILQLSQRRTVPEPERFDPEEPLLDLVDHWAPRYDQAGIRFLADLAPVDPILGDPIAVRDAVSCLLDNALKYRREDIDSAVWLNLRQDGRTIEIEVLDNGIGVPRDEREAIFKAFTRVEGPNRGRAGGHGLGLHQVAEIARTHRGTIRCETGVDGGSRFVLRVPAAQD